jgi:hypothetical protein
MRVQGLRGFSLCQLTKFAAPGATIRNTANVALNAWPPACCAPLRVFVEDEFDEGRVHRGQARVDLPAVRQARPRVNLTAGRRRLLGDGAVGHRWGIWFTRGGQQSP